jgi:hypothetical protein
LSAAFFASAAALSAARLASADALSAAFLVSLAPASTERRMPLALDAAWSTASSALLLLFVFGG